MEHNWKIKSLIRNTSGDVVKKIGYVCKSMDSGVDESITGRLEITGSADSPGFINFQDLTKGEVIAWVTSSIDYESIQNENSASISKILTQREIIPVIKHGKPKSWGNN